MPADKAAVILERLYAGKSLKAACEEVEVSPRVVSDWKAKDQEFAAAFAHAREEGAHFLLDEAQDLADNSDVKDAAKVKIQVELRAKRAACFCPRVFGAKAALEHSGQVTLDGIIGQTIVRGAKPEAD